MDSPPKNGGSIVTLMKSPPLQSMSTWSYVTLSTRSGSAMKNTAQASWGRSAVYVNCPSRATMSRHPRVTHTHTHTHTHTRHFLSLFPTGNLFCLLNILPIFFLRLIHCKLIVLFDYSIVYYSVVILLLCLCCWYFDHPLAQEFTSGFIKLYLILSYITFN